MARTVIRTLEAWDSASGTKVQIQPGTLIGSCSIRRGSGDDVYLMEFESTGARYCCPLAQFQPRTVPVDQFPVEESTARNTVAV